MTLEPGAGQVDIGAFVRPDGWAAGLQLRQGFTPWLHGYLEAELRQPWGKSLDAWAGLGLRANW